MSSDPELDPTLREQRRQRRTGSHDACDAPRCGAPPIRAGAYCYEHRPGATSTRELDHVAGRANLKGLVMGLTPNAHRRVTEIRTYLGKDDWPDAGDNPLLAAANALAGWVSVVWVLAEWLRDLGVWLGARLNGLEGAPPPPFA